MKSVQIQSFFWSVFFCIRTEYGDLLCKSPYSVWIREKTDKKKLRTWKLFTQCNAKWWFLNVYCSSYSCKQRFFFYIDVVSGCFTHIVLTWSTCQYLSGSCLKWVRFRVALQYVLRSWKFLLFIIFNQAKFHRKNVNINLR